MFLPRQPTQGQGQEPRVGVKGVRFKQFETAVADILSNGVRPCFYQIPPRPTNDWPWNLLPPAARVQGNGLRSVRKEQQLRSLLQCVVAMLPHDSALRHPYSIVDFGGGSGHLSIPLALLFPHCEVVVVDLKAPSLRLVHEKALRLSEANCDEDVFSYPKNPNVTEHDNIKRACRGIPNLFTFHGSIELYPDNFDLGVSLHACGEASDLVLRACARVNAQMVVAPCCVGKLNRRVHNPYVYHATGENIPTVTYPQSLAFQNIILAPEDWDAVAKAADYSDWDEMKSSRNATRRTAKALLETDRLLFLQEQHQYCTALVRMDPWEASPKHDVLLAWRTVSGEKGDQWSPFKTFHMIPDDACNADVQTAWEFLLDSHKIETDSVDWTLEEQRNVEGMLQHFIQSEDREYRFPTRMGGRKRKLIHYLAHQLGLLHWPEGYKDADKTVVVGKKRYLCKDAS